MKIMQACSIVIFHFMQVSIVYIWTTESIGIANNEITIISNLYTFSGSNICNEHLYDMNDNNAILAWCFPHIDSLIMSPLRTKEDILF